MSLTILTLQTEPSSDVAALRESGPGDDIHSLFSGFGELFVCLFKQEEASNGIISGNVLFPICKSSMA